MTQTTSVMDTDYLRYSLSNLLWMVIMSNLQVTKDNVINNGISAALFKAAAEEVMPSASPSCIE